MSADLTCEFNGGPKCRRTEGQEEQESESGTGNLDSLCFMSQVHDMSVRLMTTGRTAVVHQLSAERIRSTYSFS
jgi:hypothetical protein